MLGKLQTHEFAYGATCDSPAFGPVRNPWDPTRSPGGSSGGTAAAVAARLVAAGTGSDTGGSIRIPASWCGVVGLTPTYGMQIVGARFDEATVLRIGAAYEAEAGWHRRRPPIG